MRSGGTKRPGCPRLRAPPRAGCDHEVTTHSARCETNCHHAFDAETRLSGGTLLLIGGPDSPTLEAVRKKFEDYRFFWLNERFSRTGRLTATPQTPPPLPTTKKKEWSKVGLVSIDTAGVGPLPTDDWPFLYLRERAIPNLNLRSMAMIGVLSLVILLLFAPCGQSGPTGRCSSWGPLSCSWRPRALFTWPCSSGSTWVVNSVVFFAILVMILLSNLFVLRFRPKRLWPFYALLIAALLVNIYVPMSEFLALPGASKVIASCGVAFLPIFFAGVIFVAAFRDSRQPDIDFGSNIGGVILGGLSENISLMVGFNHMLVLAIAYYVLSAVLKPRGGPTPVPLVVG